MPALAQPTGATSVPSDAKVPWVHATGLPPYRCVLRRRIEQSKSLLADPDLTITEVALRSGFASHSHFSTAFHRLTPWRYRQALR